MFTCVSSCRQPTLRLHWLMHDREQLCKTNTKTTDLEINTEGRDHNRTSPSLSVPSTDYWHQDWHNEEIVTANKQQQPHLMGPTVKRTENDLEPFSDGVINEQWRKQDRFCKTKTKTGGQQKQQDRLSPRAAAPCATTPGCRTGWSDCRRRTGSRVGPCRRRWRAARAPWSDLTGTAVESQAVIVGRRVIHVHEEDGKKENIAKYL